MVPIALMAANKIPAIMPRENNLNPLADKDLFIMLAMAHPNNQDELLFEMYEATILFKCKFPAAIYMTFTILIKNSLKLIRPLPCRVSYHRLNKKTFLIPIHSGR